MPKVIRVPRRERAQRSRQSLLEAGRAQRSELGYAGATATKIARNAGVETVSKLAGEPEASSPRAARQHVSYSRTMESADQRMSADEFLRWSEGRRGRFELAAGRVVAMAPERVAHVRMKARVWRALDDALRVGDSRCEALTDGATVRIDDATVYEPDALVHCGETLSPDAIEVPEPVVVVEVLSPSTAGTDAAAKLDGYLSLPTVAHYLIVKTDRPALIHHHRRPDGSIETSIHHGGRIEIDPPGLVLDVAALLD